jgi:ribosomal-protein-alanine N-acetyltransferase
MEMAPAPTLTGPRVRLRAPAVTDADAVFTRISSDPEVTRYLAWRPHPDVTETRRVITSLFNVDKEITRLIEVDDVAVGLCARRYRQPHEIELGYCLARDWWGRGLMSEVVALLLDEIARDTAVYRVSAFCHVDNAASAGVLRRCGLTPEGRLARYSMFPNISDEPQDVLLFGKALR